MVKNIEEVQQFGKENVDAAMKSFGACSKSMQAIAVELADYSKRVFEQGTAATEKLMGVKSLDKAFEVQSDFVRNSYEGFVAQATNSLSSSSNRITTVSTSIASCTRSRSSASKLSSERCDSATSVTVCSCRIRSIAISTS